MRIIDGENCPPKEKFEYLHALVFEGNLNFFFKMFFFSYQSKKLKCQSLVSEQSSLEDLKPLKTANPQDLDCSDNTVWKSGTPV